MEDITNLIVRCAEMGAQVLPEEAAFLYMKVKSPVKGDIVEIGSGTGGTTVMMASVAEQVGKKVYSVDPFPSELEGVAREFDPGLMDSTRKRFDYNTAGIRDIIHFRKELPDCICQIPDQLSLVFIDGLHEYSYVKRDFELILPKVAKGGWVCIHDLHYQTGQLTVEGGVYKAVNLMVLHPKFPLIHIVRTMMCGEVTQ